MLCVGVRQECSVIVEGGGATVDSPVVSVDHPSNDRQRLAHWRGLVKSGRYVREGREELKSRHRSPVCDRAYVGREAGVANMLRADVVGGL